MDELLYIKYSNDRAKEYNVATKIYKTHLGRRVVKKALCMEAEAHVSSLVDKQTALSSKYDDGSIVFAKAKKCDEGVEVEWIQGESFAEYLDDILSQKGVIDCIEKMRMFFQIVFAKDQGDTIKGIDLDMLFSNVIYQNGIFYDYDYEWYSEKTVEKKYFIYRCLMYYLNIQERECLREAGVFASFGLTPDDCMRYAKEEVKFQDSITHGHMPLWELQAKTHGSIIDVKPVVEKLSTYHQTEVYFDFGNGFAPEHMRRVATTEYKPHKYRFDFWIDDEVKTLRVDPVNVACIFRILDIRDSDTGDGIAYECYGYELEEGYLFLHDDPQFFIRNDGLKSRRIFVDYEMYVIDCDDKTGLRQIDVNYSSIGRINEMNIALERQIAARNREMARMNNSIQMLQDEIVALKQERDLFKDEVERMKSSTFRKKTEHFRKKRLN